jgi:CDP-glucose 4,6-dehydratase
MGDLVNSLYEIFKRKKILITGDTGFKGSWLAFWLHYLGAEVFGYSLQPEQVNDHYVQLRLDELINHKDGDIRDISNIGDYIKEINPEFVFHLAAQPLVRKSYHEPKYTFDTNVGGTVNILEVVRTTPSVKVTIMVTSDKCYKNNEWCWGYREIDELGGKDPYSASKAAAEIVFSAYQSSFFGDRTGFGAASVRAGNVIGGGDWSLDRIVPDCIKALQKNESIHLRNPLATRPWQHVLEPLSGYLVLAALIYTEPDKYKGSYNFGPDNGEMHTVKELTEELIAYWGTGNIKITNPEINLPEAKILHLNCDKAKIILHWYPKWNFKKSIEQTAVWYKRIQAGENAREITKEQIIEYMES